MAAITIQLKLELKYATVEKPTNLSELNDVLITALTDGQILIWDDTGGKWYNITLNADNVPETATRVFVTPAQKAELGIPKLPLSLAFSDQRGNGAYAIQASDAGKMVIVDDAVSIPAGLGAGFQCAVINAAATAKSFTPNAAYTTVIGAPSASISADGLVTIGVRAGNTIVIKGETE
jgi:hypothetical protein